MKNRNRNLFKASLIISSATLISRILGFSRDLLIVWFLDSTFYSDAFFTALRIPEIFRKLSSEGSLSASLIIFFSGSKSREDLKNDTGSAFVFVLILFFPLVCILITAAPFILDFIAGGFVSDSIQFDLTVHLSRLMFPYLLFISLSSVAMAVLNSNNNFHSPAFSPVIFNLIIIASLIYGYYFTDAPVLYLAAGVSTGGLFQLIFQLIPIFQKDLISIGKNNLTKIKKDVKKVIYRSFFSSFGLSITHLNLFSGTVIATFLSPGSVTYLYIADRLMQFPLSMFGSSIANAFFPEISKMENRKEINKTFLICIRLILFIVIPASLGLIMIREPLIIILFEGRFSGTQIATICNTLLFYSCGMSFFAVNKITVSVYISKFGEKIPFITNILSFSICIILSLIFVNYQGVAGIALASSLSGLLSLITNTFFLKNKNHTEYRFIIIPACKILFNSAIMGAAVYFMINIFDTGTGTIIHIPEIFVIIVSGVIVYAVTSFLTGSDELKSVVKLLTKKDIKVE